MRKKLLFILCLFLLIFTISCKEKEEEQLDMNDKYQKEWKEYLDSYIPETFDTKVPFETEYTFNDGTDAIVEWTSSNTKSISNRGAYMGNVMDDTITINTRVIIPEIEEFTYYVYTFAPGEYTKEEYTNMIKNIYIPDVVYSDIELKTTEDQIFEKRGLVGEIVYKSSEESVLSSTGKYNISYKEDTNVLISFTVTINGISVSGEKEVKVLGRDDEKRISHALEWLDKNWYIEDTITSDITFPLTDDDGMVQFIWESLNKDVVDDYGHLVAFIVDQEVKFNLTVKMNDTVQTKEIVSKTISKEETLAYLFERMHDDEINQSYFTTYVVSGGHKNDDYGFLNFYVKDLSESSLILTEKTKENYTYGTKSYNTNVNEIIVNNGMCPIELTYKRPLITSKVEFICIHDTGDNSFTAKQWANEVQTSTRQVSWHFTVDDKDIYQQIPLEEVAYHAGDGSNKFKLTDTGVRYTKSNPTLEVKDDGYIYINGEKSKCKAPTYTKGSSTIVATKITPAGIYTCLGDNGNYYINNYYYNSGYGYISNGGGNRNSIGIETCINDGCKYSKTMRTTANLVAHLLNLYNLDTSRVLQHRNFSGKLCPQSMIRANDDTQFAYEYFKEMIEIEYFILKNTPDLKVTYESLNPEILSNDGTILSYVTTKTEVSYKVKASWNGITYEHTFTTIINPIS